jgi:hypothetical protein
MAQTLWEHWTKKEQDNQDTKPVIHNELSFSPKQMVSFDVLDYRGKDYVIGSVEEHRMSIEGQNFFATDYVFSESSLILRACDKKCWLLSLEDEFGFDDGFLAVVTDAMTSSFNVGDDTFFPLSNSLITVTNDRNEQRRIQQWSFRRTAKDEAGQEFNEMLFIEKCENSGWFTLRRGSEIVTECIFAI